MVTATMRSIDAKLLFEQPPPPWAQEHMMAQHTEIQELKAEIQELKEELEWVRARAKCEWMP